MSDPQQRLAKIGVHQSAHAAAAAAAAASPTALARASADLASIDAYYPNRDAAFDMYEGLRVAGHNQLHGASASAAQLSPLGRGGERQGGEPSASASASASALAAYSAFSGLVPSEASLDGVKQVALGAKKEQQTLSFPLPSPPPPSVVFMSTCRWSVGWTNEPPLTYPGTPTLTPPPARIASHRARARAP